MKTAFTSVSPAPRLNVRVSSTLAKRASTPVVAYRQAALLAAWVVLAGWVALWTSPSAAQPPAAPARPVGAPDAPLSPIPAASRSPRVARPLDLFSNSPALDREYFRVAAWNLRHLEVEEGAAELLPGETLEEDRRWLLATYAQAIRDLRLDALAIVEHQPHLSRPHALDQLCRELNQGPEGPWLRDESRIEYVYPRPDDPNTLKYGYLQFGLIWNSARGVHIDPAQNRLLEELRQPRDASGALLSRESRAPWLVPVSLRLHDRRLDFDWIILHLKSGGADPQPAEVAALAEYLRRRLTAEPERHVIVAGDWNIRPDHDGPTRGRTQLRKLAIPTDKGPLLNILTVTRLQPTLDEWEKLDEVLDENVANFYPLEQVLPFSHYPPESGGPHTLLDHVAISRSLEPFFHHPLRAHLADGRTEDLVPGVEIVRPLISGKRFEKLTDHLPVVLTLRVPQPDMRQRR